MKPVKVLVLVLLTLGLILSNQSITRADKTSGNATPTDIKAQDIADIKEVEDLT